MNQHGIERDGERRGDPDAHVFHRSSHLPLARTVSVLCGRICRLV